MRMPSFSELTAILLLIPGLVFVFYPKIGARSVESAWAPAAIGLSVAAAAVGVTLYALKALTDPALVVYYFAPLYQLAVFKVSLSIFRKNFARIPREVAFNWERGLFPDRVFAIGVALLCMLPVPYVAKVI
jgi:hypothetical protein